MSDIKEEYYKIIESYVEGRITADDFENIYSNKYLNDDRDFDDNLFDILDRVFAETDLYTKDSYLLEKFDFYLNEDQLFEGATKALQKLRNLNG